MTPPIAGADVLVVGDYYADLVFRGLARQPAPGTEVFAEGFDLVPGGAFNAAMALHRLGCDVVWAADFGTDVFSAQVLRAARAEGLGETAFRRHPAPVRSVTVAMALAGDRAMVSYQDPVRPRSLAALLRRHRPRALLLPLLRYDPDTRRALRLARERGTAVFMDCQDVPATLSDPQVRDALAATDVFAPNAAEALRLTAARTVEEALEALTALTGTVVVKRGPDGATGVRDGRRYDVAAVPIEAAETTGCGDCFNAGFLHALLAGRPLPACLAAGVACGAAAATGPGSSAAPDLRRLRHWLARVPPPTPAPPPPSSPPPPEGRGDRTPPRQAPHHRVAPPTG